MFSDIKLNYFSFVLKEKKNAISLAFFFFFVNLTELQMKHATQNMCHEHFSRQHFSHHRIKINVADFCKKQRCWSWKVQIQHQLRNNHHPQ